MSTLPLAAEAARLIIKKNLAMSIGYEQYTKIEYRCRAALCGRRCPAGTEAGPTLVLRD